MQFVRKMLKNEKGATAIEYGLIAALIAAEVNWPVASNNCGDGPLAGAIWVVTGKLESMGRDNAEQRLRALGAKTTGSVSAKTTTVLAGSGAGSKRKKAETLGIEIIDESEWLALMEELE